MADASNTVQLSTDLIVRTAMTIADEEGLDALSMRRVASELGCAAMSLYGYVANKDALLEALADHVLIGLPEVDGDLAWQDAVVEFFAALHQLLIEHPAVAQVMTQRPTSGENTQRHGEHALAVLRAAGLPDRLAVECFIALSCYTLGAALYTSARAGARAENPEWVGFGSLPVEDPAALEAMRPHLAERAGREQVRSGLEHLVRGYAADTA